MSGFFHKGANDSSLEEDIPEWTELDKASRIHPSSTFAQSKARQATYCILNWNGFFIGIAMLPGGETFTTNQCPNYTHARKSLDEIAEKHRFTCKHFDGEHNLPQNG
jgi:hypothetical protein